MKRFLLSLLMVLATVVCAFADTTTDPVGTAFPVATITGYIAGIVAVVTAAYIAAMAVPLIKTGFGAIKSAIKGAR